MEYREQISGVLRTPEGLVPEYMRQNPITGAPVSFHCRTMRGPNEVYLQAKEGYRGLAFQPGSPVWQRVSEQLVNEAVRQLSAVPESATLEWHVSDSYGSAAIRNLLEKTRLFGVKVIYTPKLP